MSAARAVRLVATREIVERVRSRGFLVSLAVQVLILGGVVLVAALSGGSDAPQVGVVGTADPALSNALRGPAPGVKALRVRSFPAPDAARAAVRRGDVDAAVVGSQLVIESDPSSDAVGAVQAAAQRARLQAALEGAGAAGPRVRAALDPRPLRVAALQPQAADHDARKGLAFIGVILLFISIQTYGLWVATGVVEEKSSRIVEVLLSTIRPGALLAGKVLGLGLLGLGQLVVIIAAGLGAALASGAVDLPSATGGSAALLAVWFVAGYALYSCLFAVSGALVSRQEDLQSATAPLTVLLLAGYFVAFSAISHPDGTLAHAASLVPLSAPMTMPARVLLGDVPAGEVVLSLALTAVTVALLVRVAGRVYAGAVLRMGARVRLREAWRRTG